jgi:hypothetical protein
VRRAASTSASVTVIVHSSHSADGPTRTHAATSTAHVRIGF